MPDPKDDETKPCSSCGAPILWGVTEANGKPIPLDPKTRELRAMFVPESGKVRIVATFLNHFATCPSAGKHRKPAAKTTKPGEWKTSTMKIISVSSRE